MIRASIESVPPIRRIKNREIDHLRKFAAAMRRSLPDRDEVDLYWGLHFALAMAHQTIRDSERLTKLSEGSCDLNDVEGIIDRIVAVSVMALAARPGANRELGAESGDGRVEARGGEIKKLSVRSAHAARLDTRPPSPQALRQPEHRPRIGRRGDRSAQVTQNSAARVTSSALVLASTPLDI